MFQIYPEIFVEVVNASKWNKKDVSWQNVDQIYPVQKKSVSNAMFETSCTSKYRFTEALFKNYSDEWYYSVQLQVTLTRI